MSDGCPLRARQVKSMLGKKLARATPRPRAPCPTCFRNCHHSPVPHPELPLPYPHLDSSLPSARTSALSSANASFFYSSLCPWTATPAATIQDPLSHISAYPCLRTSFPEDRQREGASSQRLAVNTGRGFGGKTAAWTYEDPVDRAPS